MHKEFTPEPGCCGEDKVLSKKRGAKRRAITPSSTTAAASHPDHSRQIARLNRVIGQLEGVRRMIEQRKYCPEILIQTRAVASALKMIEMKILATHMEHCVAEAFAAKDVDGSKEKIEELVSVLGRF